MAQAFNYRTGSREPFELANARDYIPQSESALGLYDSLIGQGKSKELALSSVLLTVTAKK